MGKENTDTLGEKTTMKLKKTIENFLGYSLETQQGDTNKNIQNTLKGNNDDFMSEEEELLDRR